MLINEWLRLPEAVYMRFAVKGVGVSTRLELATFSWEAHDSTIELRPLS